MLSGSRERQGWSPFTPYMFMALLSLGATAVVAMGFPVPMLAWVGLIAVLGILAPAGGLLALIILHPTMSYALDEGVGTTAVLSSIAVTGLYALRNTRLGRFQGLRVGKTTGIYILVVFVLAASSSVGAMLSGNTEATRFLVLTVAMMLLALVIAHYASTPANFRTILWALVFAGGSAAALALLGTEATTLSRLTLGDHVRALANPAALAMVALMAMVLFPCDTGGQPGARWRPALYWGGVFLFLSVLLLTASRGSLLGVFAAFVVAIFWKLSRQGASRKTLIGAWLGSLIAGFLIFFVDYGELFRIYFPVMAGRFDHGILQDTRGDIWSMALGNLEWPAYLIGVGPRGFQEIGQVPSRSGGFRYAHSFFVDWFFVFGALGVLVAAGFLVAVLRRVVMERQDDLVIWGAFVLFGFLTHGHAHSISVWLVIGLLLSAYYRDGSEKKSESKLASTFGRVGPVQSEQVTPAHIKHARPRVKRVIRT